MLDTTGKSLWETKGLRFSERRHFRYFPTMALGRGKLFVTVFKGKIGAELVALDTVTGARRWVSQAGGIPSVAGNTIYVRNRDGLTAVGAEDGRVLWHARKMGDLDLAEGVGEFRPAVVASGMVFVSSHKWIVALAPGRVERKAGLKKKGVSSPSVVDPGP